MVESQPQGPREGVRVGMNSRRHVAPRGRRSMSDREGRAATPSGMADPTPGSWPSMARMGSPRPEGLTHGPNMSCTRRGEWPRPSLIGWPHRAGPASPPGSELVDDRGRAATIRAMAQTSADPLPSIDRLDACHVRYAREHLAGELTSCMKPREASAPSWAISGGPRLRLGPSLPANRVPSLVLDPSLPTSGRPSLAPGSSRPTRGTPSLAPGSPRPTLDMPSLASPRRLGVDQVGSSRSPRSISSGMGSSKGSRATPAWS